MLDKYFRAFQFLGGAVVRKKCRDLCFRELVGPAGDGRPHELEFCSRVQVADGAGLNCIVQPPVQPSNQ